MNTVSLQEQLIVNTRVFLTFPNIVEKKLSINHNIRPSLVHMKVY